MTNSPGFVVAPLQRPSFVQRLLHERPLANAPIALNNMLASGVREVRVEDVERLASSYHIRSARVFVRLATAVYCAHLQHCFEDRVLSDNEIAELTHLKAILGLNDQAVASIHRQVTQQVYKQSVDAVLADGRLDETEKTFLRTLQSTLQLPDELARKLYSEEAHAFLRAAVQKATSNERLSPEEDEELKAIQRSLGVQIDDERTQRALATYRAYWVIENGELPVIDTGMHLQRNETCHAAAQVEWYEHRQVTRRIRYGGPTARIRIAKGIYWRMGDLGVQRVSEDVLAHVDTGTAYVTNERLLFRGSKKNTTIRLPRILDFTAYKNGIEIEKDSGKNPFLAFEQNVDIFAMVLGRVLRDVA